VAIRATWNVSQTIVPRFRPQSHFSFQSEHDGGSTDTHPGTTAWNWPQDRVQQPRRERKPPELIHKQSQYGAKSAQKRTCVWLTDNIKTCCI
jgi:hypothetical protein